MQPVRQELILLAPVEGLHVPSYTPWPLPDPLQLHGGRDALDDFLGEVCPEPNKLRASMIEGLGSRDARRLLHHSVYFAEVLSVCGEQTADDLEMLYEKLCQEHLRKVQSFFLGLWMVRDFSFELPYAYLLGTSAAFR